MDIRAAYFTPEQAREIMDMVALFKSSGLLRNASRFARPDDPGPYPVFVKNESGEEAPAFACMQVVGTEDVGDLTYVKIDKPSSTDGQYLFNGESPIESGGYGMSYPWGVVRMLTDGTITPNGIYGPTVDAWGVEELEGGPFVVYGADNAADDVARGRFLGGGQVEADVITGVTLTSTHLEFSLTRIWVNKSEELEDVIQIAIDECEE